MNKITAEFANDLKSILVDRGVLSEDVPIVEMNISNTSRGLHKAFFFRMEGANVSHPIDEVERCIAEKGYQDALLTYANRYINSIDHGKIMFEMANKCIDEYETFGKQKLYLEAVNISRVEDDMIYLQVSRDIALLCRFVLSGKGRNYCVTVTNRMLDKTSITKDRIIEDAKENTLKLFSPKIMPLSDVIGDPFGESTTRKTPIVVTNERGVDGASMIFMKGVADKVCDMLSTDTIIILPSSVHETLCLDANTITYEYAASMVHYVNMTEVNEEDRLSDFPVIYNRSTKQFISQNMG